MSNAHSGQKHQKSVVYAMEDFSFPLTITVKSIAGHPTIPPVNSTPFMCKNKTTCFKKFENPNQTDENTCGLRHLIISP